MIGLSTVQIWFRSLSQLWAFGATKIIAPWKKGMKNVLNFQPQQRPHISEMGWLGPRLTLKRRLRYSVYPRNTRTVLEVGYSPSVPTVDDSLSVWPLQLQPVTVNDSQDHWSWSCQTLRKSKNISTSVGERLVAEFGCFSFWVWLLTVAVFCLRFWFWKHHRWSVNTHFRELAVTDYENQAIEVVAFLF